MTTEQRGARVREQEGEGSGCLKQAKGRPAVVADKKGGWAEVQKGAV